MPPQLLCAAQRTVRTNCYGFPPPATGRQLQVTAEVIAVVYSAAALLVQLQAALRANAFLSKYRQG